MQKRLSDLSELINATQKNLEEHNYSKYTISHFYRVWKKLATYMQDNNLQLYEPIHGLAFLHEQLNYPEIMKNPRLTSLQKDVIRAIRLLNDYQHNGTISGFLNKKVVTWSQPVQILRDELIEWMREHKYSKGTIKSRLFAIDRFLKLVVEEKNVEIHLLNTELISEYVAGLTEYTKQSVSVILRGLKVFFVFLFEKDYIEINLSESIPRLHGVYTERIPHILSIDDVKKLLNSVDRGSPIGKRDYAILVIAATLGLRDSDITNLTFDNLDWEKSRIELLQRKTGKLLCLPLIPAVGEAIIDYLKYGRPQNNTHYVFVKHIAPYDKRTAFYSIMGKYLTLAGIKSDSKLNKGLHILRHTLASELIRQGEPITTISAILGHSNSNSTGTYSHIDIDGLLKCAIDIQEVVNHVQSN